jgi:hypothetical protein
MNTENDNLRFDRLVDGELSENERRELLAGLDSEPSGWRRCALAFLEAQCWKQAFGSIAKENESALTPEGDSPIFTARKSGQSPSDSHRSAWPGRLGTVLAMAASFMAAVWIGSLFLSTQAGKSVSPSNIGPGNEIAVNAGRQLPPEPFRPENNLAAAQPRIETPSSPWQVVNVSLPSNGQTPGQSINVPAQERNAIDEQWLRGLPPAIPDNVLQALARTGHEIKQRRELVPVPLKDGRRLAMPVDQVEVHYVGNGSY